MVGAGNCLEINHDIFLVGKLLRQFLGRFRRHDVVARAVQDQP